MALVSWTAQGGGAVREMGSTPEVCHLLNVPQQGKEHNHFSARVSVFFLQFDRIKQFVFGGFVFFAFSFVAFFEGVWS